MAAARRPRSPAQYLKDLLHRTQKARELAGIERPDMVARLRERTGYDITVDQYKKWETRTPLPHFCIIPFCEITGVDPWLLLTGKPLMLSKYTTLESAPAAGKHRSAA